MSISRLERSQLNTIIRKLDANDKIWLHEKEIMWSEKGDWWVLNYVPGGRNPYNRLCRGLVVKKDISNWSWHHKLKAKLNPSCRIASFPFVRFYNHGETYIDASNKGRKASIDFANSSMIEKLDGTMVGVFFPYGDHESPEFHTRRMISTHKPDMEMKISSFHSGHQEETRLMELIGRYVETLKFEPKDVDYTYIFEFLHESTRVLTQYSRAWNGLWLIGARNLHTFEEIVDQDELDTIACRLGCRRPLVFKNNHDNLEKILALMEQREKDVRDFEGVVFLDQQGNRVKLKRERYVTLHHLLGEISYKHLIPRILNGEEHEIVAYFASAAPLIKTFKQVYKNYWAKVANRVRYWRDQKLDRKSLALQIFRDKQETDTFVQNQTMSLFQEQNDDIIWQDIDTALRRIAATSPKRLMEVIGLNEVE